MSCVFELSARGNEGAAVPWPGGGAGGGQGGGPHRYGRQPPGTPRDQSDRVEVGGGEEPAGGDGLYPPLWPCQAGLPPGTLALLKGNFTLVIQFFLIINIIMMIIIIFHHTHWRPQGNFTHLHHQHHTLSLFIHESHKNLQLINFYMVYLA